MEDVTKACRDLNRLSAKGKIACKMFLEECKKHGLNVLITETYRSQERQSYLYAQGRTRPGKIVTQIKTVGYHNTGNAWDICKNVKGHEYDDPSFFAKCGTIAKKLGIEWGGYWNGFKDTPHFQISSSWEPPKSCSDDLSNAVSKIISKGININYNAWSTVNNINLNNVPGLIIKLGGIDKLYSQGVITDKNLWAAGKYNKEHVVSLIVKYSLNLK